MGDERRREAAEHATNPPPRVCMVARTERSPGFGPPLAFPVSQWRMSGAPASRAGCPLQWRGRAGIAPASEQSPFAYFDCSAAAQSTGSGAWPQERLERALSATLRAYAHSSGAIGLAARYARVERGDGVEQPRRTASLPVPGNSDAGARRDAATLARLPRPAAATARRFCNRSRERTVRRGRPGPREAGPRSADCRQCAATTRRSTPRPAVTGTGRSTGSSMLLRSEGT